MTRMLRLDFTVVDITRNSQSLELDNEMKSHLTLAIGIEDH